VRNTRTLHLFATVHQFRSWL